MTLRVTSYGGGMQSNGLLVLAAQGKIDYKTFIFCNVGEDSEHPATLRYVHEIAMPYAEKHGIELIELRKYLKDGTADTLYGRLTRPGSRSIGIPVHMASNGAPANRACTIDFKIKVVDKWLREHGAKEEKAVVAIGISLDEFQRMKPNLDPATMEWKQNAFPLIDLRMTRQDCINVIQEAGLPVPPRSACYFCLAGETEVITSNGTKSIKDLVGHSSILVPMLGNGKSKWQNVEIRSFGKQELMKVVLRRGRSLKEIHATPEHRWVTKNKTTGAWQTFSPTQELKQGDIIPSSRYTSVLASRNEVLPSPFGIAQGFVYGDGHVETRERGPATVILHGEKAKSMLPYFPLCNPRETKLPSGKTGIYIYNLPRQWKNRPPLSESRGYLLGWLAGYFAADGYVSKEGQAIIYSATKDDINFVRDVCYILGVQTSPLQAKNRRGFNGFEILYNVSLYTRDLPDSFWINEHHRTRIQQQHEGERPRRQDWLVESVETTDRVEEVFCAIVPEVEMFVLADNIVTGNCPYHSLQKWQEMRQNEHELFQKSVDLEKLINERRAEHGLDAIRFARKLVPLEQATTDLKQPSLFDEDTGCDSGYCWT